MSGVLNPAVTMGERLRILLTGKAASDDVPAPANDPMLLPGVAHDFRTVVRAEPFKRGRPVGTRAWSKVVGITWHQTASGDLSESHPQLLAIPAHILLHRSGRWSLLHPFTAYVQHGHALNGGTIGIEVDCRAAGVEGDPRTFWRSVREKEGHVDAKGRRFPPQDYHALVREATQAQLAAIPLIMKWCAEELAANGGKLLGNWAHRQGHKSRVTDPGSRIWKSVEGAEKTLRRDGIILNDYRDRTLGSGKTIPQEWRTT